MLLSKIELSLHVCSEFGCILFLLYVLFNIELLHTTKSTFVVHIMSSIDSILRFTTRLTTIHSEDYFIDSNLIAVALTNRNVHIYERLVSLSIHTKAPKFLTKKKKRLTRV